MGGRKWSNEEVAVLTKYYGRCRSRVELLEKLSGRSYDAISMKAFLLGLKGDSRNSNRQYDLWFDAFGELTPDAAYWAGFIAADGHITVGSQLSVGLALKDQNHLRSLKKYLRYNGPIDIQRGRKTNFGTFNRAVLLIQSVDLCKALDDVWNIPPGKKSDVLELPDVQDELLIDYIAGYFDGDGCAYHDKRGYLTITFVGNEVFLKQLKEVVDRYFNISTALPYKNTKHSDAYMYRVHGAKAREVLSRFSQNKNSLKRKRL